jgi:hypothetical protein
MREARLVEMFLSDGWPAFLGQSRLVNRESIPIGVMPDIFNRASIF